MSRQPPFLDTFSILDNHFNSNFKWGDVNGRCYYFVDASYRHPNLLHDFGCKQNTLQFLSPFSFFFFVSESQTLNSQIDGIILYFREMKII